MEKFKQYLDGEKYIAAFSFALTVLIIFYNITVGLFAFFVFVLLFFQRYRSFVSSEEVKKSMLESFDKNIETLTKKAVFSMPFPSLILDGDSGILWHNSSFLKMVGMENIKNKTILDVIPSINLSELNKSTLEHPYRLLYKDEYFHVYINRVEHSKNSRSEKDKYLSLLYFIDETELEEMKKRREKERVSSMLVYVDNLSEVKNSLDEAKRLNLAALVEGSVSNYFQEYEAQVRKYDDDKYLININGENLQKIIQKKFDILDIIREINIGNSIPVSLSIAATLDGENPLKQYEILRKTMDVALGRGGDQAVFRKDHKYEYFGGKSKAVEKSTKVKTRVVGLALNRLIDDASNAVIMPHANADMDAIGSAIGVLNLLDNKGKEGYIVLNSINPSIKNIMAAIKKYRPELDKKIKSTDGINALIDENTLLIMVDHHKKSISEAPELVDKIKDIVIIDHHRRGEEFVDGAELVYLEPYASSTSELVTELYSYMLDKINLSKFEAEALLAGIAVDTKNFTIQTGVRTFEAASTLRRFGADPEIVRHYFKDDYNVFMAKADAIHSSEIFMNDTIIARINEVGDNSVLTAAQAADELLGINGIKASFVCVKLSNSMTHISARSLGEMSVQLIMEKLGGGGHLTSAAARMEVSQDIAVLELKRVIEEYKKEEEDK